MIIKYRIAKVKTNIPYKWLFKKQQNKYKENTALPSTEQSANT